MEKIEVVYEDGKLRPLKPLKLREGKKLVVRVEGGLLDIVKKYQKMFKLSEEEIEEFLEERR
jgi:predicted DNA-binding antitoxin AbrB/MazE fold protein